MDMQQIARLKCLLEQAKFAVFFGGAGMSTESGIPDFRSSTGLYSDADNEYAMRRQCLKAEPERFFRFFRTKMLYPDAQPNAAHRALARLEQDGKLKGIITQNIDELHQKAGSRNVIEIHGTAIRSYCQRCGKLYLSADVAHEEVPRCVACGGIVRPDVVLDGEGLDAERFEAARELIAQADLLIVGGTSLTVYPAASLVADFEGQHLVIVNKGPTGLDGMAELIIRESVSEVFSGLI